MIVMDKQCPVVMVIGGNDPVGGAGLCADTQVLAAHSCHTAPVITAITLQTSCGVTDYSGVEADMVRRQMACVVEDMPVAAIKTGMLASSDTAREVGRFIEQYPDVPLVIDPVMASNTGNTLSEDSLLESFLQYLLPLAHIVTPNLPELKAMARIAGCSADEELSTQAMSLGVPVLVTGTHDSSSENVINRLYRHDAETMTWEWERLPAEFHGSGCTLATALAANLARGADLAAAAADAQRFTWRSLNDGLKLGACQRTPNRFVSC